MANIVISYSREDQPLVRGLVKLLRAGLQGIDKAVFWDDDFEYGDPWFAQFEQSVREATALFVVWCSHSAVSKAVARELHIALEHKKRLVPVLLDRTTMPDAIAALHGVDLRGVVEHSLTKVRANRRKPGWHLVYPPPDSSAVGEHIDAAEDPMTMLLAGTAHMLDVLPGFQRDAIISNFGPVLDAFARQLAGDDVEVVDRFREIRSDW